jgi:hypothetical protein
MPGINLVADINPLNRTRLSQSFQELKYREKFILDHYFASDKISIGFLGYKGYPSQSFENNDVLVLLEGFIYNKSDLEIDSALRRMVDAFPCNDKLASAVAAFMDDCDGDFLVIAFFKNNNDFLIFNGRWGRLPAYYSVADTRLALSRDMKFLLSWAESITFDQIALAEFLSFEYCLGEKSLFREIRLLPPATLIYAKIGDEKIEFKSRPLYPVDLSTRDNTVSRNEAIKKCVSLFRQSLLDRARRCHEKGLKIVVDVSGGYDTRAVLAGLASSGLDFTPATDHLFSGDESAIAAPLAALYGKEIKHFQAAHPFDNFEALKEITYLTDGSVNCQTASACFWDDLEREKSLRDMAVHFMGFGGEFIRHPYRPMSGYNSLADMLDHDSFTNFLPLAASAALLGLERADLSRNLRNETGAYPEKCEADKVKHLYFDYYNRLVSAGENRHRLFSWTVPPLWGKFLFEFEMTGIPPSFINYEFYINFLKGLDPRLLGIPLYGHNVKLNGALSLKKYLILQNLKGSIRSHRIPYHGHKKLRRFLGRFRAVSNRYEKICDEIMAVGRRSGAVAALIKQEALRRFLLTKPPEAQLYQILTVIFYIEEIERRFSGRISY